MTEKNKRNKAGSRQETKKKTVLYKKKKIGSESSTESEPEDNILVHDDSDKDASDNGLYMELNDAIGEEQLSYENITVNDYLIVKCTSLKKNSLKHFVGVIKKKEGSTLNVSFMKKNMGFKFSFPDKEDIWHVILTDVVAKLPDPENAPGTSRTASLLKFKFDFEKFNLG